MPLRYIACDGGTFPAGLPDSPESESRNLACWHTGEREDLRPCGEPPSYSSIRPRYQSSCLSKRRRRRRRRRRRMPQPNSVFRISGFRPVFSQSEARCILCHDGGKVNFRGQLAAKLLRVRKRHFYGQFLAGSNALQRLCGLKRVRRL